MTRMVNQTEKNLQRIWDQLDDAVGSLYNATENIQLMSTLPKEIKNYAEDRIDSSAIIHLRDKIGELIEEKKNSSERE